MSADFGYERTRPGDLEMASRTADVIKPIIMRGVTTPWLVGIVGSVLIWAGSQWSNYAQLNNTVVSLVGKVNELTIKLDTAANKNMEQDFAIKSLEQRVTGLISVVESMKSTGGKR